MVFLIIMLYTLSVFECKKVNISNHMMNFTGTNSQSEFYGWPKRPTLTCNLVHHKKEPILCLLNLFLRVVTPLYILKICIEVLRRAWWNHRARPLHEEKERFIGKFKLSGYLPEDKEIIKNAGRALPDDRRQVVWRREPVSWDSLGDRVARVGQNGLGAMAWELVVGLWPVVDLFELIASRVPIAGCSQLQRQIREVMASPNKRKPTSWDFQECWL